MSFSLYFFLFAWATDSYHRTLVSHFLNDIESHVNVGTQLPQSHGFSIFSYTLTAEASLKYEQVCNALLLHNCPKAFYSLPFMSSNLQLLSWNWSENRGALQNSIQGTRLPKFEKIQLTKDVALLKVNEKSCSISRFKSIPSEALEFRLLGHGFAVALDCNILGKWGNSLIMTVLIQQHFSRAQSQISGFYGAEVILRTMHISCKSTKRETWSDHLESLACRI